MEKDGNNIKIIAKGIYCPWEYSRKGENAISYLMGF